MKTEYYLGSCGGCDGHIEFPKHGVGQAISCPHCGTNLRLIGPRKRYWLRAVLVLFAALGGLAFYNAAGTSRVVQQQVDPFPVSDNENRVANEQLMEVEQAKLKEMRQANAIARQNLESQESANDIARSAAIQKRLSSINFDDDSMYKFQMQQAAQEANRIAEQSAWQQQLQNQQAIDEMTRMRQVQESADRRARYGH